MDEAKFAKLDQEKIQEIKQLEQKLNVTLIAYDMTAPTNPNPHSNNSIVINPS